MEAIILAGGRGTRLQSVVSDVPKPMAPIGDKPFLAYLMQYLAKEGIRRVILSVGYKADIIEEAFGDRYNDIEIAYSREETPLGTGGAVKKALQLAKSQRVFILNGDTFFDVPLKVMHTNTPNDAAISLALKLMNDFDRYGCVETDANGKVTAFTEKAHRKSGAINGGVYLVRKDLFDAKSLPEVFSFETFMQEQCQTGELFGIPFDRYFIDIGIPEDYRRACEEMREVL